MTAPEDAGLLHLTGRRCMDETSGDYFRLRCVLCEAVVPERHQGISQDTPVLVSHTRSGGRPIFHLELHDDMAGELDVWIGPMRYRRCDTAAQVLA